MTIEHKDEHGGRARRLLELLGFRWRRSLRGEEGNGDRDRKHQSASLGAHIEVHQQRILAA